MANKKISQLTTANPLTGLEQLPIAQSGVTVKTTLDDVLTYSVSSSIVNVSSVNDTITFTKGDGTTTNVTVITSESFNAFTSSVVTTSSFNAFTSSVVTTSSFNAFTSSYNTGSFSGSLVGTATTSSFITASNVYGPYGSNSVVSASYALSSSYALTASIASNIDLYKYYAKRLDLFFGTFSTSSTDNFPNQIGNGSGDGINDISWSYAAGIVTASMSSGPFTSGKTLITGQYAGGAQGIFIPVVFSCDPSNTTTFYIKPLRSDDGNLSLGSWSGIVEIKIFK